MPETEDETVYVVACGSGTRTRTFHTDRDCQNLNNARKIHESPRSSVADRREECLICQEGFAFGMETDKSTWRAAVEADPEDISP